MSGPSWFHGEFVCPSNFHKRKVHLSAPSLEHAMSIASEGANGCNVEVVDQIDCPWLDRSCKQRSLDLREAMPLLPGRLLR